MLLLLWHDVTMQLNSGDAADKFMDYQDEKERVVPSSHCWTPSGDVIVGCKGGQLVKVRQDIKHANVQ